MNLPSLTIAYITCRPNPRWEWFLDSLAAQTKSDEQRARIQLVFVDGKLWDRDAYLGKGPVSLNLDVWHDHDRIASLAKLIQGRFPDVLHIPPKPCTYQGPWRQTTRDMFCAGNTRDTAFIVAKHEFVVFVDDLSVLMPGWLDQVLHAAEHNYVVCGMYKKVHGLRPDGSYDSIASTDSRWDHGSDSGLVPWHGSGMYGCSFGLPLEAALEVDGNDPACNGQGGEDTDFGTRLERAGWPVFLNRNMLTLEDEDLHHDGSKLPQNRYPVQQVFLPKGYDSYHHARQDEKYWSDHVLLNRLNNEHDRILPTIRNDLEKLRAEYQRSGLVPVPPFGMTDWRTGKSLATL